MFRFLWLIVTPLFLISCTTAYNTGLEQLNTGQYQAAYNTFSVCANQGNSNCMNSIGVMYARGNMAGGANYTAAVEWYTLAARYGNATAQHNLIASGAPVPPADLQQQSGGGGGDAAAAMLLMGSAFMMGTQSVTPTPSAVQPPIQPTVLPQRNTPVNCTSTVIGDQIRTSCY